MLQAPRRPAMKLKQTKLSNKSSRLVRLLGSAVLYSLYESYCTSVCYATYPGTQGESDSALNRLRASINYTAVLLVF